MNFEPNWVSPPGTTVLRLMAVRGLTDDEVADDLGLELSDFQLLLKGELRINSDIAEALSTCFGSTPRFWMARDIHYSKECRRLSNDSDDTLAAWARKLPVQAMRQYGWLKQGVKGPQLYQELLTFFDCRDLFEWKARYLSGLEAVAFRTSAAYVADDLSTQVWRRMGDLQASKMDLPNYDPDEFRAILPRLKRLSAFKHPRTFIKRLQEVCRQAGVAVTTARTPSGCRASGATWKTESGNPIIHLSFRHMSDDHFWFTFYHEAAHVLLHRGEHIDTDAETSSRPSVTRMEREADDFAAEALFPTSVRDMLLNKKITPNNIMHASKLAKVAAGVVVGQLESRKVITYGQLSFLKHRYRWGQDALIPELKET